MATGQGAPCTPGETTAARGVVTDGDGQRPHHRRNEPQPGRGRGCGCFRADLFYIVSTYSPSTCRHFGSGKRHHPFDGPLHREIRQDPRKTREADLHTCTGHASAYHWPGNVRELENCIERAVILAPGDSIESYHLPPSLQLKSKEAVKRNGASSMPSSAPTSAP